MLVSPLAESSLVKGVGIGIVRIGIVMNTGPADAQIGWPHGRSIIWLALAPTGPKPLRTFGPDALASAGSAAKTAFSAAGFSAITVAAAVASCLSDCFRERTGLKKSRMLFLDPSEISSIQSRP